MKLKGKNLKSFLRRETLYDFSGVVIVSGAGSSCSG